MPMKSGLITYRKAKSIQLECTINLDKLFVTDTERERFKDKWPKFLKSDKHNKKIYQLRGDRLTYLSEQLIPTKTDRRPPLLLVLGNPASHSVDAGMFFSFEGNGKEHRFWKYIMRPSGLLDLEKDPGLPIEERNRRRRQRLLKLDYNSKFRIGLCVFISMPSGASGEWSGIAGIHKLIGAKAMRRLEAEERKRVIKCAKKFVTPGGAVVTFQKNAWNTLRSDEAPLYSIDLAKKGKLKGTLASVPDIPLFGVPPTRLAGTCRKFWKNF